jgi:site-specific recombinase XerD
MNTDVLLEQFSNHLLAAGRSAGTVRLRLVYLRQFAAEHSDLLAVGRVELEGFLAARRLTHKAETRASIRTALRLFYAWAFEEEYIPRDPSARLAPVRKTMTVPRVAVDADIQLALLGASTRDRAIILLARFGCLRRNEIATLHSRHRDHGHLRVLGKGEKQRRVPINPMLMDALLELERVNPGDYYFPDGNGGHLSADVIHHTIQARTGWNPHSLRHAGATAAYRATRDLRAVQELLGHASIATTQRYLHVDEAALRAVADATATGFESVA